MKKTLENLKGEMMTVSELIVILQTYPAGMQVVTGDTGNGGVLVELARDDVRLMQVQTLPAPKGFDPWHGLARYSPDDEGDHAALAVT